MQSYMRPSGGAIQRRAIMGIRAPRANQCRTTSKVNAVIGLVRCRSDRSRHDHHVSLSISSVSTSVYAAATEVGTDPKSRSKCQTAHTMRASLLATAIAAMLCPRLAATVTAHC
jgi:hypothetical protein